MGEGFGVLFAGLPVFHNGWAMETRVRTEKLRKLYTSPPPSGAQGVGASPGPGQSSGRRQRKKSVEIVALADLSLEVQPGEIVGLLGPNGAGKSTTVGILTTRIRPTQGKAWIGEYDVWQQPVAVKRLIGVVPQRPNLDLSLTVREILLFHAAYFGIGARERNQRASELLEQFQLTDRADQMVTGLSGGMGQRLSIARALMHRPEVLFLDEPSAGLDPQTRLLLWDIVRDFNRQGGTVLLTTHYMEEADALSRRIAIIDHGRIIAQGTPQQLKDSIPGGYVVRLRFDQDAPKLLQELKSLPEVREIHRGEEGCADIYADRGGPLVAEIVRLTLAAGVGLHDVHISEPSLENLFLHHTGRSLRE